MMHIKPERKYFLHHCNQMTAVDLNVWGRMHSEDISKIMWCKKNLVTTTIVFIFIRVNQGCYVHRDWNITFLIIETVTKNLTQIQKHVHCKKSTILLQVSWYLGNILYSWASHSDKVSWLQYKNCGFFTMNVF